MTQRLFVAGIWHETNTFSPIPTDLARFKAYQYAEGAALIGRFRGTGTELGGIIEAAAEQEIELVPGLFAAAVPSGPVSADAFEAIVCEACSRAVAADGVGGAVLVLHGAMTVSGVNDADAAFVEAIRRVLPERAPIVVTLDLHANVSRRLVDAADALVIYDTFPHVDFVERGAEAVGIADRLLRTPQERPHKAFRKLPLLTVPQVQATTDEPMSEIMRLVHEREQEPDVLTCSVAQGFPYADVDSLGVAVVAYGSYLAAERAVAAVSAAIWAARDNLRPTLVPVDVAIAAARDAVPTPVVLVEPADNVGGGAPGDGAILLAALLEARVTPSVTVIWDPAAVSVARAAGVGGSFDAMIGGRTLPLHGPPARVAGRVEKLMNVTYSRTGSYMPGQVVPMGEVAVIDAFGVRVVVTSERVMPFDSTHLTVLGIRPEDQRALVAKSGAAWRAAFGDVAASAIYVDTPGICASNLERLPYRVFDRRAHPLQEMP